MNFEIDEVAVIYRAKRRMEILGYKPDTLAEKTYLGRSTIYRMLDGTSHWSDERIRLVAKALLVSETYLRTGREEIEEPEINAVCVSKMFNTFRDYLLELDADKVPSEINRCGKEFFDIIIEVAWNSRNK